MTTADKPSEPIFSQNAAAAQALGRTGGSPAADKSKSSRSGLALIVTADDFGLGAATSRGIIEAHVKGPVTSTSLMVVTQDHVKASLPLLAEAPKLEVGLHLVLTNCGHPPLVARESSGLVDDDGQFFSNARLWIRAFSGSLNRRAICDEITAQADLFCKMVGRRPAYVDSHHHAHQLPIIRDALLDVIAAGALPAITRITRESRESLVFAGGKRAHRLAAHFIGRTAVKLFEHNRVWCNEYYFGMLGESRFEAPFPWNSDLECLQPSGIVEWIVHPGFPDETLAGRDPYRLRRPLELEHLVKPSSPALSSRVLAALARKSELAKEAATS
jgi:chitin disaccharide deacetylase